MAVAGANLRGASRIIAVGTRPACVEAAKGYGAVDFISYKDGTIEDQVLAMTDGKGVDKVVVAGGGCETFESAVKALKPGGKIGNVNYLGSGTYVNIPRQNGALAWATNRSAAADARRTSAHGKAWFPGIRRQVRRSSSGVPCL